MQILHFIDWIGGFICWIIWNVLYEFRIVM